MLEEAQLNRRRESFNISVVMLLLIVFSGCATVPRYRPDLPEDIGNNGLFVGQIVCIGTLPKWSSLNDIVIDGKINRDVVVNGFFAIPLSPGEHTLNSLHSENSDLHSSTAARTVVKVYRSTLRIRSKFRIRSGAVTDLGLMILYADPKDTEQKDGMPTYYLDNRADMKLFLKYSYPALVEKLHVDNMSLAPAGLLPADRLSSVRQELADRAVKRSDGSAFYVAAAAGTLAQVQFGEDGKQKGFNLIDMPSLAGIRSASPAFEKDRAAFLTNNNRLFIVEKGKTIEKRAPFGLRAGSIFAYGTSEIAILDDHFELYTSSDNGDSWQMNTSLRTDEVVNPKLAVGKDGYYLFAEKNPKLLFSRFGKTEFMRIALPDEIRALGAIHERPAGLFAEELVSPFKEGERRAFVFRPTRGTTWEKRSMPYRNCTYMRFLEEGSVIVECSDEAVRTDGDKDRYISADNGKSWQKNNIVADKAF